MPLSRQNLGRRSTLLGACAIALTRVVKLKTGVPGQGEVDLDPHAALDAIQKQVDRARTLDAKAQPADAPPVTLETFYFDLFGHLHKLTRGLDDADRGRLTAALRIWLANVGGRRFLTVGGAAENLDWLNT